MVLGLVQGLTEFLPVSSSGHLVLGGKLLGLEEPHLVFDVVVHVATLCAIVAFYRRSVAAMLGELLAALRALPSAGWRRALAERPEARLAVLIVIGTIPTGLIGVVFKDPLEALFAAPRAAAGMLLVTAVLLLTTRWSRPEGRRELRLTDALVIGLIQGFAIVPGISRSGSTIACALLLGVDRELAARFSFLLSIPAIVGALILQLGGHGLGAADGLVPVAIGFVAAAISGVVALAALIPLVKRGRLHWFAAYLIPVGLLGLLWL